MDYQGGFGHLGHQAPARLTPYQRRLLEKARSNGPEAAYAREQLSNYSEFRQENYPALNPTVPARSVNPYQPHNQGAPYGTVLPY